MHTGQEFSGCVVICESTDGGQRFRLTEPTCRFACNSCPCTQSREDQIDQAAIPAGGVGLANQAQMVYRHRGMVMMAGSPQWLRLDTHRTGCRNGYLAFTGFRAACPYAAIGAPPFSVDEHSAWSVDRRGL